MNKENICLSSKTIEIAEHEAYLELTNRVCYYDEPNANNVLLPSEDAEEKAKTLINMPVVAKYRVNSKGEPTFGSHEMYVDEDGEIAFATESIGTHTDVYIQEDTVDVNGELKTLPCLFAKYRVWKRNKNVIAAIRRLFSEDKLYSSWEIATSAYEYKDGIKRITDYIFLSNCLLGYEYASPAYGKDARAISLSAQDCQLLIAEALSQDIIESSKVNSTEKEEVDLAKKKINDVSEEIKDNVDNSIEINDNSETTETTQISTETENSSLTDYDLRIKLTRACEEKLNTYGWIAFHFPLEKTVWFEDFNRESELDYILFTYEVSENDDIILSEPQYVKLTVKVSDINSVLDEKNNAIIKASEEIQSLKAQIAELTHYKEKFEEAEQIRIQQELAERKKILIEKYKKTGLITEKEFEESEEIKGYIDTLNEQALNNIIASRFIASLDKNNTEATQSNNDKEKSNINISASLLNDDDITDYKSIIKSYLRK